MFPDHSTKPDSSPGRLSARAARRLARAACDDLLLAQRLASAFPIRRSRSGDLVSVSAGDRRALLEASHLAGKGWIEACRGAPGTVDPCACLQYRLTELGVQALASLREHHRKRDADRALQRASAGQTGP